MEVGAAVSVSARLPPARSSPGTQRQGESRVAPIITTTDVPQKV